MFRKNHPLGGLGILLELTKYIIYRPLSIMRNKNVRKKSIIFISMLALCLPLFSTSVFAKSIEFQEACIASGVDCEKSTICGSASPTFSLMTDFMTEMLMAIKTVGTNDPYIGKYVSPNRFVNGTFDPPDIKK